MSWPTCDPATWGAPDNEVTLVEGPLSVSIHFTWDGTSTPTTGCDGALLYADVVNASPTVTGYAWFYGRTRKTWKSITIAPLTGVPTPLRITKQQLHTRGFDTRSDTEGIILSTLNTPPAVT